MKLFKFLVAVIAVLLMVMIAVPADATVDTSSVYLAPESLLMASPSSLGPQHDLVAPVQIQSLTTAMVNYINDFDLTTSTVPIATAEHIVYTVGHFPSHPAPAVVTNQPRPIYRT